MTVPIRVTHPTNNDASPLFTWNSTKRKQFLRDAECSQCNWTAEESIEHYGLINS